MRRPRTTSLCRVARRKRCWRKVKEQTPVGRSKPIAASKSQKCRDEELTFFLDSGPDASLVTDADHATVAPQAQDVPFFLDTAPDSSMLIGVPTESAEPPPAALPAPETVVQQEMPQEEGDDMPPPEPLAFRVIPSTETPETALEAAWIVAPEEEQEMCHLVQEKQELGMPPKVSQPKMEVHVKLLRAQNGKVLFLESGPDFVEAQA
eukprot:s46_g43.t1